VIVVGEVPVCVVDVGVVVAVMEVAVCEVRVMVTVIVLPDVAV
jgi:hypothetical protein